MSKVNDFKEIAKGLTFPAKGPVIANVLRTGDLSFERGLISAYDAIQLAHWILDVYDGRDVGIDVGTRG